MLTDSVKKQKWENIYSKTNINDCVDTFYEKILDSIDKARVLKKFMQKIG